MRKTSPGKIVFREPTQPVHRSSKSSTSKLNRAKTSGMFEVHYWSKELARVRGNIPFRLTGPHTLGPKKIFWVQNADETVTRL